MFRPQQLIFRGQFKKLQYRAVILYGDSRPGVKNLLVFKGTLQSLQNLCIHISIDRNSIDRLKCGRHRTLL